ncbi:flagellar motor switch protein FliM [Neobacillus notoginsengisoli]|uniref:Flagellar motor switch protein FliM n=1 Tax=Neobacillus notoginsengisoli TaxID=1578198 RepID=A0A417YK00_9BACI|nr:flagellar motor switch protein FliM [Neobacillus notoginsengisoli]RHW33315.1 flagellar motor switch protein FliM [Neobacillus notoginsengisoli]
MEYKLSQKPSAGGAAAVKIYDFKKALRLSMEQVRVLSRIHENFAYQLASFISAELRSIVQVEVGSVEQMLYEEFINELPDTTILSVFEASEQEIRMVLDMNPDMAYGMIDRLLGGKGSVKKWERTTLTPIETNVLKHLLEGVVKTLQNAWADMINLQLRVLNLETNPQFLQLAIPTETVIIVTFNITIGKVEDTMRLCIPYILLEPFIPKLSSHNWYGHGKWVKNKDESDYLQEKIEHLAVPLIVELGRATISVEELLGLAENDVIQLNQLVDEPLHVKVNNETKFLAHPGTRKSRVAAKIEKVIEGDTEYDGTGETYTR